MGNVNDLEIMKALGEEATKNWTTKKTKDELLEEYKEINNRLHHLREMENEAQAEFRVAMERLNGIQSNIEKADDELAINNGKLQSKDY